MVSWMFDGRTSWRSPLWEKVIPEHIRPYIENFTTPMDKGHRENTFARTRVQVSAARPTPLHNFQLAEVDHLSGLEQTVVG